MGQTITVVDAFTDRVFSGNPAAVCVLEAAASESWMQAVATEMNLPMTAFPVARADGDYDLRWFTPTAEVDLCGHATLASSHLLAGDGEIRFHTKSGILVANKTSDGTVAMDFPALPVEPLPDPPDWSLVLGLTPDRVVGVWMGGPNLDSGDEVAAAKGGRAGSGGGWDLVELASAADVRAIVPDQTEIMARGGGPVLVVATPGDSAGIDSVCRMFNPGIGIPEDAVTGSAHCVIGPWLAGRTGRDEFRGEQASARSGHVGMRLAGDRVILSGRAVTVLNATLHSAPQPS